MKRRHFMKALVAPGIYLWLTPQDEFERRRRQRIIIDAQSGEPGTFDYYVSTSGNDSNPGTEAQPFASLYKASVTVAAGESIGLKRGDTWTVTQNRNVSVALGVGITITANNVTVGAYGSGAKPIIDATAQEDGSPHRLDSPFACVFSDDGVTGLTVEDLDLRGPHEGPALDPETAQNITVRRCDFSGAGWEGECLFQANGAGNILVEDCYFDQFTGNTEGYSKSIEFIGGSGHIIRRNIFEGFESGGALRFSNNGTGALIERNYFFRPDERQPVGAAWAMVIRSCNGGTYITRNNVFDLIQDTNRWSSSNLRAMAFWDDHAATVRKIFNNTIISNGLGTGIHGTGGSGEVKLYNNIFYDLQTGYDNPSPPLTALNNCWYSVGNKVDGSFDTESGSFTTDPNLIDDTMGDDATNAAIQSPSDCIDGSYTSDADIPTDDFTGAPRSGTPDVGAFEV